MSEVSLTLYNNSSAPNVVHKSLSQLTSMTGDLIEDVNVERVVLHVPYFESFASCNYAYIPEFKRYYYVNVEVMNGERLKLSMRSDPLTSFYSNYCASPCIAKRSSSNYNVGIADNVLNFKPQPKFIRRKTSSKFTPTSSGGCYILTIGGK